MAAFAVIITGVSCAEEPATLHDTTPAMSAATAPGSISMRLSGTDAQGRAYWLRSATFTISPSGGLDAGAQGTTISSDDDPNADLLSVSLDAGSYDVTLQPGWYLEYQTSRGGVVRAQNVRLASPSTQPVAILADQSAELTFRFSIDDTGRGQLDIGVEVETVSDAGADASVVPEDAAVDGGLDAGLADAGESDAEVDAAEVDAEIDAAEADAAEADAGEADAAEGDAGETDAAAQDAGETDAEIVADAGESDAGDATTSP